MTTHPLEAHVLECPDLANLALNELLATETCRTHHRCHRSLSAHQPRTVTTLASHAEPCQHTNLALSPLLHHMIVKSVCTCQVTAPHQQPPLEGSTTHSCDVLPVPCTWVARTRDTRCNARTETPTPPHPQSPHEPAPLWVAQLLAGPIPVTIAPAPVQVSHPHAPGLTLMMSTRSTWSSTYSICDREVPGFSTTPALQPRSLIWFTVLQQQQQQ
mgnify:CR=1 FL=1